MRDTYPSKQLFPHSSTSKPSSLLQMDVFLDEGSITKHQYHSSHSTGNNKSIRSIATSNQTNASANLYENIKNSTVVILRGLSQNKEKVIHKERFNKIEQITQKPRQIKLQRYSRLYNQSKKQILPDADQQFQAQNKEKISLLKRIIEHYNIKSLERSYYSNLVNSLGIKLSSAVDVKNRFATVKNIAPKNKPKRESSMNVKESNQIKIKQYPNLLSMDIYNQYFKSSNIKVEAKRISNLNNIETMDAYSKQQKMLLKKERNTISKSKLQKPQKFRQTKYSKNTTLFATTMKTSKRNITKVDIFGQNKSKMIEASTQNCINLKVNKYKQFLFIINFSNNVYRELDIQKYQNTFKIYIGKGNNNNLITGLMKKRFWFEIVKDRNEANFIWTQLKDQSIFQKQDIKERKNKQIKQENSESLLKRQPSEKRSEATCIQSTGQIDRIKQNGKVSLQTLEFAIKHKKQLKLSKLSNKTLQGFQPQLRVLTNQQLHMYNQINNQLYHKRKGKFSDKLRYMKKCNVIMEDQLNSQVVHNHLPLNGLLGNKKAMFYMLKQFYRLSNRNIFQTVPLTFHIKKGLQDEQYRQLSNYFTQNRNNKLPNYWIIKPGQFSNRGQGITCTSKMQDIRNRINNVKKHGKNKSLIIQQYITNPLLYNGRKFDIRTYMLVSVNNGKLRSYWYQDGYIRTSSYIWRLDQITDTSIHLTNDAIQKYTDNYGKYEPGNKLTYSELQRYLDTLPKIGKSYNFQAEIYPKLKQIATDAIKSSFYFIDPSRKANNFEIFGFDFMIDANFKPWLIEINTNPCLQVNCPVLQRIIPSMVQNSFRIALDPIFPPPLNYSSTYKYNIPQNAMHYNKFELIFDEQRDGSKLLQLYKYNNIVQTMDDYEQDKETYEQEGEEINPQQS